MQNTYNPARGDVRIEMGGRHFVLRPSFQAIAQMEAHFARGIIAIARDYHNGKITAASDFLALLEIGIRASGETVPENLPELMVEKGIAQLIEPLGQYVAHACGIFEK